MMRRVGTVVRAAQGLAVVRCADEAFPETGTELLDESLDPVGEVVEVFGPVDRPYLAVTPAEGRTPAAMLDEPLYARESN